MRTEHRGNMTTSIREIRTIHAATNIPTASLLLMLASIACVLLAACAAFPETDEAPPSPPVYRYVASAEMSSEYLKSSDGSVSVLRPAGWQWTEDRTQAPSIVLWLVREDYSASLSFTPMQMDPALYETLKKDGLEAVAKISMNLKMRNADDSVRIIQAVELFRVGQHVCAAYEYRHGLAAPIIRIVVFDTGRRFMECALYPAKANITPAENRRLFEVQQSVLASLVMK